MGDVMLKVPAEYADDFRAAIVEELAWDIDAVRTRRAELAKAADWGEPPTHAEDEDLRAHLKHLDEDAELVGQVGLHLTGAIELFDTNSAGALAHVFETMVDKVLGPRLSRGLNTSPIDRAQVDDNLDPLLAELTWAVDNAADFHTRYWQTKEQEKVGS